MKVCILCKKKYEGYGNNASPLKKGKCCDECNIKVIQARVRSCLKCGKEITGSWKRPAYSKKFCSNLCCYQYHSTLERPNRKDLAGELQKIYDNHKLREKEEQVMLKTIKLLGGARK